MSLFWRGLVIQWRVPYTQSFELIRGGVFGTTITTYGDPAYTTFALAILTLFGLWLMREGHKYVVIE